MYSVYTLKLDSKYIWKYTSTIHTEYDILTQNLVLLLEVWDKVALCNDWRKNEATFFRPLTSCQSRHRGAPYAILNTIFIVRYWLRTYESRNKKRLSLSGEFMFEFENIDSAILSTSWPDFSQNVQLEKVVFTKKLNSFLYNFFLFLSNLYWLW